MNKGFVRTYEGGNVTRNNFLGMLLCNSTADGVNKVAPGPGLTPCLRSTAEDDVFIVWAGHGGPGALFMPEMSAATAVYADELVGAIKTLKARKAFKRMVIYVEACESGSMFEGKLDGIDGVFVLFCSRPFETFCRATSARVPNLKVWDAVWATDHTGRYPSFARHCCPISYG